MGLSGRPAAAARTVFCAAALAAAALAPAGGAWAETIGPDPFAQPNFELPPVPFEIPPLDPDASSGGSAPEAFPGLTAPSGPVSDLRSCRAAVSADPVQGRERAAQWQALGGGAAAELCAGEALASVGAAGMAAQMLMTAAADGDGLELRDRAGAFGLAGELLLDIDEPELARRSFGSALRIDSASVPALIGRARASGALGDWSEAMADLNAALAASAGGSQRARRLAAEALTLRAAAHRRLEDPQAARADAQQAIATDEAYGLGWYELGAAQYALGDPEAAKEAWVQAVLLGPAEPAGQLAEFWLQQLLIEE